MPTRSTHFNDFLVFSFLIIIILSSSMIVVTQNPVPPPPSPQKSCVLMCQYTMAQECDLLPTAWKYCLQQTKSKCSHNANNIPCSLRADLGAYRRLAAALGFCNRNVMTLCLRVFLNVFSLRLFDESRKYCGACAKIQRVPMSL